MSVTTIGTADLRSTASVTIGDGGATVDVMSGDTPDRGWLVALPNNERIIPLGSFSHWSLEDYVRDYATDLTVRGNYLGTWLNGTSVYLDTSVLVEDRLLAEELGRAFGQLAIYNIETGQTIDLV